MPWRPIIDVDGANRRWGALLREIKLEQVGAMRIGFFFIVPAFVVAGLVFPAPAGAECYEKPSAYVIWAKCDKARAKLKGVNLKGAVLEDAVLHHSDLSGANLERADLRGADLLKANLSGANLKRAKLQKAILKDANLSGADLTGADLTEGNLERANLSNAKLDGTKLQGVRMAGATWIDGKTKCKGGSVGSCIK
jgi:uncharacterized protein YjbI with pentapeptide repeats